MRRRYAGVECLHLQKYPFLKKKRKIVCGCVESFACRAVCGSGTWQAWKQAQVPAVARGFSSCNSG